MPKSEIVVVDEFGNRSKYVLSEENYPIPTSDKRGHITEYVYTHNVIHHWNDGRTINDDGTAFDGNRAVLAVAGAVKWLIGLVKPNKKETT